MYPWLRMPRVIVAAKLRRAVDPMAELRLPLRVLPGDVDAFSHLNNGRYLTLCDLGRFDWAARAGMLGVFRKHGWFPVIASAAISFRRSLELFQRFELSTQMLYWDRKWFYIEHGFHRGDAVCCRALVKGAIRNGDGKTIQIIELLKVLGKADRQPPPMPDLVRDWPQVERHLRR